MTRSSVGLTRSGSASSVALHYTPESREHVKWVNSLAVDLDKLGLCWSIHENSEDEALRKEPIESLESTCSSRFPIRRQSVAVVNSPAFLRACVGGSEPEREVAHWLVAKRQHLSDRAPSRLLRHDLPTATDYPLADKAVRLASNPKAVFMSYSHDPPENKYWVGRLAEDLRASGLDVVRDEDEQQMTAPCGLDCFNCIVYLANGSQKLRSMVSGQLGVPMEQAVCKGCRNEDGKCAVIPMECNVYPGAKEKGIKFCYDCSDFPCDHLHPYADQAANLPHNTKVFNLCLIKKLGLKTWAKEKAKSVKNVYFSGKWKL